MLSLKIATVNEAPAVAELFKELYEGSVYARVTDYNPGDVVRLVSSLTTTPESGVTLLLYAGDTLIGAMICSKMRQVFNQAEQTAVELGFWITPDYRSYPAYRKVVGAYRYWAKKVGCTTILYGKLKDGNSVESYVIRKLN